MSVSTVLHHAALAVSVVALGAAGMRVASALADRGLERGIAAIVLAVAAAVAHALVLGLVGLGTDALALTAAAGATWLASRIIVAPPPVPVGAELARWWVRCDLWQRVLVGAAAGAWAAWTAWLLRYPALGHDMVLYHVPEAISWVHNGRPGSVVPVISVVPVGNYPLTYEVLLAWGMGLARSFVPVTLVVAAMPPLIVAAGWLGLRTLGVGRAAAALAPVALVATPAVIASQSGGASLDPAALAWLLCCAALCAGARDNPRLLVPAVVAAGLAIGTKTTAAPLTLVVLAVTAFALRSSLRALVSPLGAAAGLAAVVGGYWYLRNLVDHGSPLWPFVDTPWGDPRPSLIEAADVSFLDRPGDTLDRLSSYYWDRFGGPIIMLAGALVVALLTRSRAVAAATLAAAGSVLLWMNAPFTGVSSERGLDLGTGDATRYLLPGVAAAALALALASRHRGIVGRVGLAGLAAGAVAAALSSLDVGFPAIPRATTFIAGAIAGGAAALAVTRISLPLPRVAAPVAVAGLVVVAAPIGALAADGFVERYAGTSQRESPLAGWVNADPRWHEDGGTIVATWSLIGPLSGDRLQHALELRDPARACAIAREGAPQTWVTVDRADARLRGREDCPGAHLDHEDQHYRGYAPDGGG